MADSKAHASSGLNKEAAIATNGMDLHQHASTNSEEKGPELEQVEDSQTKPKFLGKRQRVRRHCARRWWWWLIGVIVFLAIFLPCLFLKIIPAVIQDMINKTDLPILNATIGAYSATELQFSFSTVFKAPGSISARMESFNLSLYNAFTEGYYPYTYVTLPEQELKGSTDISIASTSPVTNYTELEKWLNTTFYGVTTELSFHGSTRLHFGALSAPVSIKKTVTIAGLNQLQGFAVDSSDILGTPEADGSNLIGNVTIPNPGTVAIEFGELIFNAAIANIIIGNMSISDATLYQGNNTFPFTGIMDMNTMLANYNTIMANASGNGSDATLVMAITGNSCLINGQHIPYVEAVLDNTTMYSTVPVSDFGG
ncbi:hypothetical protein M406DRAFT_322067 [Cryphonectria parasitica EP155]|uniref:Uncharacterized protein n=1 Tax=Cryphonectria parasitica (strain ATCC 38755 / EP155) TaxID=660469 RepID=A0A9P4Y399_CRYP1|nr:uncharacterized protein M406DRAFT_322067 [Cryphonectria parasitica EP155]KAF3765746.1 hypothetical protein M406DRAFT_322067 [Cryphonectria parasitica EP155]